MKAYFAFLLCLLLVLCSCAKITEKDNTDSNVTSEIESTTKEPETQSVADADSDTCEVTSAPLPCYVCFYDDLDNNGIYTKLYEWESQWAIGRDIAVFDIIPSIESELQGYSYSRLWLQEAEKLPEEILPDPYFVLEYTLSDGNIKSKEIHSYVEAEELIDEGYIEIYLYDDIANANSSWYSHLTKYDTDENTVISSIKLTAGKHIDEISEIKLTVCNDGSSPSTIVLREL